MMRISAYGSRNPQSGLFYDGFSAVLINIESKVRNYKWKALKYRNLQYGLSQDLHRINFWMLYNMFLKD